MPKVWSIVVAGGAGARFGAPKQFAVLAGRPVLEWAVEACRDGSAGVVLVLPAAEPANPGELHGADVVVSGGPTRAVSVRRGLSVVPLEADVIVVHDAARPLATGELFDAVVDAVSRSEVAGAVPGLVPGDTIKLVDAGGTVTRTLERAALMAVQTPQAFRADVLRRAHEGAGVEATDDAVLVEQAGGRVQVVPGDPANIKITTAADLAVAERVLADRGG